MQHLLSHNEHVLIQHMLCYLSLKELFLFSQINHHTHELIFIKDNPSNFLFRQLYMNENGTTMNELMEQYETSNCSSWLHFYKQYGLIKFDSEFTENKTNVIFKNNNRTIDTTDTSGWSAISCNYKMRPGGRYRWKFIVEKYMSTQNELEVVMGCANRDATEGSRIFNAHSFLIDMRRYNHGIGFQLESWSSRIGERYNISQQDVLIPKVYNLEDCVPFTIGFDLNFGSSRNAELSIYWNDQLLTTIRIRNVPPVYYPVVCTCQNKCITVTGW
jgi:hypothetical protein